jgi:hypothetical protein
VNVTDSLARTTKMLQEASDMTLSADNTHLHVRIINNTGHRLPTGYPEGRRMWVNVKFFDVNDQLVQEYGEYDFVNGNLVHGYPDFMYDTKVYEVHMGYDDAVANATGLPIHHEGGTNLTGSFHFVLNNGIIKDSRIPPRGFTHSTASAVQSAPVNYSYADGQYWDDSSFAIPTPMGPPLARAEVTLYIQTTTREYIEFLRDNNPNPQGGGGQPPNRGEVAYNAWASAAGDKSRPVIMDKECITLGNPLPAAAPIFVKADATGVPINGQNWNQAYRTLQDAEQRRGDLGGDGAVQADGRHEPERDASTDGRRTCVWRVQRHGSNAGAAGGVV